jgi:GntR family transcriptional regulator
MIFRVSSSSGRALYRQLMEQVRHAVETGVLQDGDRMPGILTLAEELVVSHNTIAKAYTELQHEGLLELRHGAGAYISAKRRLRTQAEPVQKAQIRVAELVDALHRGGLTGEEIRRLFEAEVIKTTASIIQGLQRQKKTASKGNPMSEEAKAKRRATYAKNHPRWKPKKKNHRKPDSD